MKNLSLRTTLTAAMLLMAAVTLAVCFSLAVLTMYLRDTTDRLGRSLESVRLAQEIEIDLLLHSRASDTLTRARFEVSLRQKLEQARNFINDDRERISIDQAIESIDRYLATSPSGSKRNASLNAEQQGRLQTAFSALEVLVDINLAQSQSAVQDASNWDRIANATAVVAAIVSIFLISATLLWVTTRVISPFLSLREVMVQFARGSHESRAPEGGPAELREMARQFNEMANTLARQREAQRTFLAGTAHDMRNPLSALKASVALTRSDTREPSEDQIRSALTLVERQIGALERMVSDLLDTVRVEAGRFELNSVKCDLRDLAAGVVELFHGSSPRHHLLLQMSEAPVMAACDVGRMEQVLNNLVSNAIKYSPDGGNVLIDVGTQNGTAFVSVKDSGVGIAPEDLARIFEPFRRVSPGHSAIPGVGLGLFVARQLVEAHGGRIEARSEGPGRGSEFIIRLPMAEHTQAPRAVSGR